MFTKYFKRLPEGLNEMARQSAEVFSKHGWDLNEALRRFNNLREAILNDDTLDDTDLTKMNDATKADLHAFYDYVLPKPSDEFNQGLTQRIKEILEEEKPKYFLRVDIRSYYASIPKFKLLQDIKRYYHDSKVIKMLENIITNPIDTPRGYKNSSRGIALRGPLSQFFSALYLKPLDDAFLNSSAFYLRFNDDVLILCKSKRQMNRCRRIMMNVLHERHLSLSRKKSRMGLIKDSFHFLGVSYSSTQPKNDTKVIYANDACYLDNMGGGGDNI